MIFHVWRYITCLYFSHVKISCFRANAYSVFKWWLYNILINSILISMDSWHKQLMNRHIQIKGGSRIFLGGGALVSCSTSTPINVGVWLSTDQQLTLSLNYNEKLAKIQTILGCWKFRRLSLIAVSYTHLTLPTNREV